MSNNDITLNDYLMLVTKTNKFKPNEAINLAKIGLFGEVGSFLSIYKKRDRGEKSNEEKFKNSLIEELGDIFWYFSLLCIQSDINLIELVDTILKGSFELQENNKNFFISDYPNIPFIKYYKNEESSLLNHQDLLNTSGLLLNLIQSQNINQDAINFLKNYLLILKKLNFSLREVILLNKQKIDDRFIDFKDLDLSDYEFDKDFSRDEQIPRKFEIRFVTKSNGKSYMKWNDVFIGDALGDNHKDNDDYKYHDVFHLAFASILHWSPTFRALIKHKRKSDPKIDETEDSGRAIVIEEGLSAWLFSKHKIDKIDLTKKENITYDMLKTIREFVNGYEVHDCPLQLWERAITQGYTAFADLSKYKGGIIECDLEKRCIQFKQVKEDEE